MNCKIAIELTEIEFPFHFQFADLLRNRNEKTFSIPFNSCLQQIVGDLQTSLNWLISRKYKITSLLHCARPHPAQLFQFFALLTPSFSNAHASHRSPYQMLQRKLIVKFWVFVISRLDDLWLWRNYRCHDKTSQLPQLIRSEASTWLQNQDNEVW